MCNVETIQAQDDITAKGTLHLWKHCFARVPHIYLTVNQKCILIKKNNKTFQSSIIKTDPTRPLTVTQV